MDFYEFCTLLVFLTLSTVATLILLKIPSNWFDHISNERNGLVAIGAIICGLFLLRFDANARSRAQSQFEYDLVEYEMIRTKWLEAEAERIEFEKKHNIQYFQMVDGEPAPSIDFGGLVQLSHLPHPSERYSPN